MKKLLSLAAAFATLGFALVSCDGTEPDPNTDTFTVTEDNGKKKISGIINRNYTMDSDVEWVLSGGVFVGDAATLTIEEGTIIKSEKQGDNTAFLSVSRGGKIMAEGTEAEPIVFTSGEDNPAPGDWGGIIVNGRAKLNTGFEAEGEGGTGLYGGTNDNDNSGVIRYVRVEYAGRLLGTDNELNGFSFNGCGSGTTVEYIQAYKGADDGIEFFGGSVNVKYAISTGNQDDSFDWTHGWRGNGQFWVVNQLPTGGDRGIEADNNGDDNTLDPYSNPTLCNLTLVGSDDGDGENTGMRLREGTKGGIYNAIVVNFPKNGVRVSDQVTLDNMENDELIVASTVSAGNGTDWKDCDKFANDASNSSIAPVLTDTYVGTVSANAIDPITLNTSGSTFFSAGSYIGAVETSNNWTANWTIQ